MQVSYRSVKALTSLLTEEKPSVSATEKGEAGGECDEGHAGRLLQHPRLCAPQIRHQGPDCPRGILQ